MYIGLRGLEKTSSQEANFMEDVTNADCFKERNVEVNISSAPQSILQGVKFFGYTNMCTTSSTLHLKGGRKTQAQYLIPIVTEVVHITPYLLRQLTFPEDMKLFKSIWSCFIILDTK